ncbi:MAG: AbrB/MazE/SpoVT family DNA-binding domain-containing protein [Pseudomonadota bacterium]|nr:AbrB/MazE/SpoVT family DNA-binding domain-containing protein [Pseudomonadota bacterium]
MAATRGKMVEGGRVIVPSGFRKSMGLQKGDTVLMELHGDELRIRPAKSALHRIQEKVRALVPAGQSVVDELIADRRAEVSRE